MSDKLYVLNTSSSAVYRTADGRLVRPGDGQEFTLSEASLETLGTSVSEVSKGRDTGSIERTEDNGSFTQYDSMEEFLDRNIGQVMKDIPRLTIEHIVDARDTEESHKNRSTILSALDRALESVEE
jgi:hypothetical protein